MENPIKVYNTPIPAPSLVCVYTIYLPFQIPISRRASNE